MTDETVAAIQKEFPGARVVAERTAGPSIARVIDYETTGTQEDEHAEVIELGSIDVDVHARAVDYDTAWASFARPHGEIPPVTRAVHHITDDDVRLAPEARDLWDYFLGNDGEPDNPPPQYLVAHNAKFEKHFTPDMGIPWICTMKVARIVWPDAPGHSNQVLRYWLGLDLDRDKCDPPHRALPDAYVTAHIFLELMKHKTPAEMVKISEYPALLKEMKFGKYFGEGMTFEKCAQVDPSYLEWIRDKSDMDEDRKFSAHYWLRKRK